MKKTESNKKQLLFGKRNYQFLFLSLGFICVGFFLMSGGGSPDPKIFLTQKYLALEEFVLPLPWC